MRMNRSYKLMQKEVMQVLNEVRKVIIGKDLMEGLDTDLDSFFDSLMKEE